MGVIRPEKVNKLINKCKNKPKNKKGWVVRTKDIRRLKRWENFNLNNAKQVWANFEDFGRFTANMEKRLGPFDNVINVWKGEPCFVVGGSIEGRGLDLTKLNGKHSIGVNHMIDYYTGFEWFLFQDHRFLRLNKFDFTKYYGKVFAHNSAPVIKGQIFNDLVFFKSLYDSTQLTDKPYKGIYTRALTGLCALHMAIISGANPIYIIGMDMSRKIAINEVNEIGLHYGKNYTGESRLEACYKGVKDKMKLFKNFYKWKDRIINVCEDGYLDYFKCISLQKLNEILDV